MPARVAQKKCSTRYYLTSRRTPCVFPLIQSVSMGTGMTTAASSTSLSTVGSVNAGTPSHHTSTTRIRLSFPHVPLQQRRISAATPPTGPELGVTQLIPARDGNPVISQFVGAQVGIPIHNSWQNRHLLY